jgi:hypothetical protein
MDTLETIQDDRPERDMERLANDQLDHTADAARKAARAKLRAFCDTLDKDKRSLMEFYHPELFTSNDNN